MDFLDGYVVRARLFPAILAIAPALVFLLVTVGGNYEDLGLPEVLMSLTVGVLFFAFADIARRFGRRAERKVFTSSGGRPFPTVLRHRDKVVNPKSKAHYHSYLSRELGEAAPSPEQEDADPVAADEFYVSCGDLLRERTRDQSRFHLLFAENVSYGFRRNLYGLKYSGLLLNAVTAAASFWLFYQAAGANLPQYGVVLVVAAIHALYFTAGVTRKSVLDASDQYGRQLVLSCDEFIRVST
ncbi:hypothetical protein ACC786_12025 [Rhizobium ruizarguesonis]|uniref:hypothetical protein n=1 Tax=Rhizobium ruizarguesonis TaxID=2081791 RepID=UPI00103155C6|nr:hypothetical protein [Rhizobium ruizarguesonis]TBA33769.1 hypothetical protein ELH62_32505 [Rhizobium ruizarguesonis]